MFCLIMRPEFDSCVLSQTSAAHSAAQRVTINQRPRAPLGQIWEPVFLLTGKHLISGPVPLLILICLLPCSPTKSGRRNWKPAIGRHPSTSPFAPLLCVGPTYLEEKWWKDAALPTSCNWHSVSTAIPTHEQSLRWRQGWGWSSPLWGEWQDVWTYIPLFNAKWIPSKWTIPPFPPIYRE